MNTTTRLGKIARLPHSIREQLNLKLHDGLTAKSILPWLNSLPEVQAILAADFDNRPITKQNLSEWRQGGFRDWLLQFQAAQFLQFTDPCTGRREETQTLPSEQPTASEHSQLPDDSTQHSTRNTSNLTPHASRITAKLLLWTQLQYISMARHIDSESDPDRKWTALRQFATDIARLKRSSLADDFLQIQRDWLALSQSNSTENKELEFCKWIKRPDIAEAINNKKRGLTRERLRKIAEEDLYLLGPDNPELDEHIARVRLAKELMARRKAKEAEDNRKPGDPAPELLEIKLRETTLEELLPFIPDKPLTELAPETSSPDYSKNDLANTPGLPTHSQQDSHSSHPSHDAPSNPPAPPDSPDKSHSVQPSQTESNQIQPEAAQLEPNPNHDNPTPEN
jgi:hypothetical protein